MNRIYFVILMGALALLAGCSGQDNTQVADRARLEGQAQAEEQLKKDRELQDDQIRKERGAVDDRAREMEKSLSKLQDFYEDHSGVFEGTMIRGTDRFAVRITLYPNIPRYSDSRVRTPNEIETELTALSYNAQILQWIPPNKDSVGCRINGLKPNTKKGRLNIISPDCPSSYSLVLNRTTISGTAQTETNPDAFEIYAEQLSKTAPASKKKKTAKK